jgi:hypothetical protein
MSGSGSGDTDERTASLAYSRRGGLKRRVVRHLGRIYLDSFPGLDEAGANVSLHSTLRFLMKDYNTKQLDPTHVDKRFDQLLYRLDAMHEADRMRRHIDLKFPSIFTVDVEEWLAKHPDGSGIHEQMGQNLQMLSSRKLFDQPIGSAGPGYSKPRRYLAIALIDSGLPMDEIESLVDALVLCKYFSTPFSENSLTLENR